MMIVRIVRTITTLLRLSKGLRKEAFEYVTYLREIDKKASLRSEPTDRTSRVAGLHAGEGWLSEDFDEPLPDEFWLGRKM
ncbi:MAG: hypothetical protein U5L04_16700 [Trueperaceae bacterium]|nr:hypothetical protein [Trueperaceae bacterium]